MASDTRRQEIFNSYRNLQIHNLIEPFGSPRCRNSLTKSSMFIQEAHLRKRSRVHGIGSHARLTIRKAQEESRTAVFGLHEFGLFLTSCWDVEFKLTIKLRLIFTQHYTVYKTNEKSKVRIILGLGTVIKSYVM
jgi:hypothetical protein